MADPTKTNTDDDDNPAALTLDGSGAAVAAELATKLGPPSLIELPNEKTGPHVIAVPAGRRLVPAKKYHDAYREHPERREGTAVLSTLQSLIDHANRFKNEHASALFAERKPPTLRAVIDYHQPGFASVPRFCAHVGLYPFPVSEEWLAWERAAEMKFGQQAFAEFMEERLPDVADPATAFEPAKLLARQLGISYASPGELLNVSRGLRIHSTERVANVQNLSTGEVNLSFEVTHETSKDGAPIRVPAAFLVRIPVFEGGDAWQIPIRLRYRKDGSAVLWRLEPYRARAAFDAAFTEACEAAQKATGLPLFYGTPER